VALLRYHHCTCPNELTDKRKTPFMKSRFVMEGVVILHEVLHQVKMI
jgi:hypothetical protein